MVQRSKDAPLVKLPLELKYAVGLMARPSWTRKRCRASLYEAWRHVMSWKNYVEDGKDDDDCDERKGVEKDAVLIGPF
jgi:hypothetical protein